MLTQIDLGLMRKYDKAGPRYTSYPTAPHFRSDFSLEDLEIERQAAFTERADKPLSLYFHVPYCLTVCTYCGCHTSATNDRTRIATYMGAMRRELDQFAAKYPKSRKVKQIHFGGGTPTHAGLDSLELILDGIRRNFSLDSEVEVAIEIDPRRIGAPALRELHRMGFNRVSFGIQDLDPQVQRAVGRIQSPELCASMVTEAQNAGFDSVNIDLIYGLPYQTLDSQRRTLDFVVETLRPDRVAVFNFAYLPQLRDNQRAIDPATLPGGEAKLAQLKQSIETFTASGFDFIGMDHFARPEDSLAQALREGRLHRNFQGYTTLSDVEIAAFGISSISQYDNVYSQNTKDEAEYLSRIERGYDPLERGLRLEGEDRLRRDVIMYILCQGRLVKSHIEQRYDIAFDAHFAEALAALPEFENDGLLLITPDTLEVTPLGRLFIRNIAMPFDARLGQPTDGHQPTYSRTV